MRRLLALLLAVPGAGWASHPLISEDPGVLGKGGWQIELHGDRARDRDAGTTTRTTEASAVLGYGIAERTDVQFELPYIREEGAKGRGDAVLSVKWQFYDRDGLKMVVKPDLILPTGRDELGLGAGRSGWALNLAAGRELGRVELLGHVGYTRNRNLIGERSSLSHMSAALLFAVAEKLKLSFDLARDTNPDPGSGTPLRELALGVIYAPSQDIDLGLGVKKGLSDPADDRALLAGLKFRW